MKKKRLSAALLTLGICASLLFQAPASAAEETAASAISTNSIAGWPQGPEITSEAAVIMEESTNTILYAKNMDAAMYPSAAVKVMTCLLALENSALTDQVTMTATGVSSVTDGGANIAARLDETFTMEQCLYAIMVASANDIALQVAEHIGGSVDAFVQKMNARAAELGCTDTLFTNPTGLPDENQHVTAHDMALITKAAMSNETFRSIASATSYTIPATNISGGERVLTSNFSMANPADPTYYEGCLGGKEGYTEASGSTLVTAASRNGMTLVCVVLKGASGQTAAEAVTLLDYGFGNFQPVNLGENDFSVLSGGNAILPIGASAENVSAEDVSENGQINRTYLFGGVPVGTAVAEDSPEENAAADIDSDANLDAAKDFTESKSPIPYILMGCAGLALIIFLFYRLIKMAKS